MHVHKICPKIANSWPETIPLDVCGLLEYAENDPDVMNCITMDYESWVYDPNTKIQSLQ